jgi:hypothetical protein
MVDSMPPVHVVKVGRTAQASEPVPEAYVPSQNLSLAAVL